MLLRAKGIPHLINLPIIGPVTRNATTIKEGTILIAEDRLPYSADFTLFRAVLTCAKDCVDFPTVCAIKSLEHLSEGDLIVIHSDGAINTLYRPESRHNFLLF